MAIFLEGQEEWTTDLLPELSPQEGKAVIMYSHGFSLRTIAIEVGISPHTVRVYLSRAKDKFEIHNLFELRDICMLRVNSLILRKMSSSQNWLHDSISPPVT
ncbi:hypothetical protein ALO43_200488 [Pseudomonas tremae]|uniref:TraP protein n=1 Tax=Pseudomonas tremae TaxID=200454 RepID=A0AA40P3H4_9PSED|nr:MULTISPECIES: sigma-70 region 4 domain-containing protein [Pseudomonas syringae group]EPM53366.1 hypothetical protein A264_27802 [Pseudomonas syringae pv. actinidiae ICMP 19071]EPM73814.1 hypothetical protein A3SO_27825 [Pseudomonas syringae pv. actinidiae ICMP 19072]KPY96143.1 hypothetical protein ALO43_200488 [Pseudomonas tremae]RMS10840.1 hypothetical protein ALP75_205121 [Pseudomonas syringae pv. actinidiae]RMV34451.1 hypothetical protein ALP12_200522 [Pseudomonas savastanoi pv. phaseol